MKTTLSLFFSCFSVVLFAQAPLNEWAWQIGSNGIDEVKTICIDPTNAIYTSGSVSDTTDLNPNNTIELLNTPPGSEPTLFINKHDENGELIWSLYDTSAEDEASSDSNTSEVVSSACSNQSFVATGNFTGSSDLDLRIIDSAGDTVQFNNNGNQNGDTEIFLIKLSSTGLIEQTMSIGAESDDRAGDVRFDENGNIWLSGIIGASSTNDVIAVGDINIPSPDPNNQTIFVAKMDSDLNVLNTLTLGNIPIIASIDSLSISVSMEIDHDDNVILGGNYTERISLDFTQPSIMSTGRKMFLAKYDSDLNFIWGGTFGDNDPSELDTGNDFLNDVAVGPSNEIIVSARVGNQSAFELNGSGFTAVGSGSSGMVLAEYDTNGNCIGASSLPGNLNPEFQNILEIQALGNSTILGCGELTQGVSAGLSSISGGGTTIPFWFCVNTSSGSGWVDSFGTSSAGNANTIAFIDGNEGGKMVIGGNFEGSIVPSIYPSLPLFEDETTGDDKDAFLAQFSIDPFHGVDCAGNSEDDCPSDLNGDGLINATDLLIFLGTFGSSCS